MSVALSPPGVAAVLQVLECRLDIALVCYQDDERSGKREETPPQLTLCRRDQKTTHERFESAACRQGRDRNRGGAGHRRSHCQQLRRGRCEGDHYRADLEQA